MRKKQNKTESWQIKFKALIKHTTKKKSLEEKLINWAKKKKILKL